MYTVPILAVLPTLFALSMGWPVLRTPCNCGLGPGEDMCSGGGRSLTCTPLVVRPMEVPKPPKPSAPKPVCLPLPGAPAPLGPVKNPCDCHTSLVLPATVPKPLCVSCGRYDMANNHQLTLSQKQAYLFGGPAAPIGARPILVDDDVAGPAVNPAAYAPADPVSISLAQQWAREDCYRNEDRLAFGFRTMPKEIPARYAASARRFNNVAEEGLYDLNGQVVELKRVPCKAPKSVDEEAAEALLALAAEEEDERAPDALLREITLGEIGYGPANIKTPPFITVAAPPAAPLEDVVITKCNDGFKPGDVSIKQVPKPNGVVMPPVLPEPCPPEEEIYIPAAPVIPEDAVFHSPYTYLSSSSAASRHNHYSQSVILQKVGCV